MWKWCRKGATIWAKIVWKYRYWFNVDWWIKLDLTNFKSPISTIQKKQYTVTSRFPNCTINPHCFRTGTIFFFLIFSNYYSIHPSNEYFLWNLLPVHSFLSSVTSVLSSQDSFLCSWSMVIKKCVTFGDFILHCAYHREVVTASWCWYHVPTNSADANRLLPAVLHLSRGDFGCYLRMKKKSEF